MRIRRLLVAALAILPWAIPGSQSFARELTFADRVNAQESIERVYYSHQIGTTKPFEAAVPRALLEDKVRAYLQESVALETYWKTPLTAQALARELERMARGTRLPGRLREIEAALGNDRELILECLARPALADRLARNFFAYDQTIHAAERQRADDLHGLLLSGAISVHDDHARRMVSSFVRTESGPGARADGAIAAAGENTATPGRIALSPDDYVRTRTPAPAQIGAIGPVTEERDAFVIRVVLDETPDSFSQAAYVIDKIGWDEWWVTAAPGLDDAAALRIAAAGSDRPSTSPGTQGVGSPGGDLAGEPICRPGDSWNNASLDDLPDYRYHHTAVWTGTEMIIWGGQNNTHFLNSGSRYDPATDTWSPISVTNAPEGRSFFTAVWTGTRMIVWGGANSRSLGSGGVYDPSTDTWSSISSSGAPERREQHTAVWTGSRMVVWGGVNDSSFIGDVLNSGGRYDPATDTWTPTSTTGAPEGRWVHTAVWTGSRMIIWGGTSHDDQPRAGGAYDPVTDAWSPTSTVNAPEGRVGHTAVWTGSQMIVWGGYVFTYPISELNTGGRYDPVADSWTPTTLANSPEAREGHTAVWTGTEMIVWGGLGGSSFHGIGGRYDPVADAWSSMSTVRAPTGRISHTAVWTGALMIVWGGNAGEYTGGRYDPSTDNWTPTATTTAPQERATHSAVWTGSEMIVWGGYGYANPYLGSASNYDPALDTWTPTSRLNAPTARTGHTAVWTGSEMIIWGGGVTFYLSNGGRYDPRTDTWTPTSTFNAPPGRYGHSAVWTGSSMIVWGGTSGGVTAFNTGGRYDPATDAWSSTSMTGAPTGREAHTAVWSGDRMIVWGGHSDPRPYTYLDTGGRYDPITDAWAPTSRVGSPAGRYGHTTVATETGMIVWGGTDGATYLGTGARYNPTTDTWDSTSGVDAPAGRNGHSAVWTGTDMIVWGGAAGDAYFNSGGRYDPKAHHWTPTSINGAPSARSLHSAVWTGSEMIVWGGYSNIGVEAWYRTGGRYLPDTGLDAPTADAGLDRVVECAGVDGTVVELQGSGTGCESLTFTWTGPFREGEGVLQGSHVAVTLPRGQSTITLRVDDTNGQSATDTLQVTVRDTTAPILSVLADPTFLWPADHRLVPVRMVRQVRDLCDPNPAVTLVAVTSSEPDDAPGMGDGNTTGDISGADVGTADGDVELRAERNGAGPGRIYRVTYQAVDASGNAALASAVVMVPHDHRPGSGLPSLHLDTDVMPGRSGNLVHLTPY